MYNGVINIYKEPGYTSHDVVAKLRGILGQKKIGHTGTLDPDAEGVLPVCLGAATRICDMLTDETKEYEAVVRFGVITDTQDMSGQILEERSTDDLSEKAVLEMVQSFIGEISQIPPMYSAIKQNGKKLYELARAGIEVERKPRKIKIYDIGVVSVDLPELTIKVKCSKGTYIRTLCHDMGIKLGTGAAMKHLTRTAVGQFAVTESVKLSDVERLRDEGRIMETIVPLTEVFGSLPRGVVTPEGAKKASNGNMLGKRDLRIVTDVVGLHNYASDCKISAHGLHNTETAVSGSDERIMVTDDNGFFFGVYRLDKADGRYHPVKMFLC